MPKRNVAAANFFAVSYVMNTPSFATRFALAVCNVCLPGYAKDVLGNCLPCKGESFHVPVESWVFLFVMVVVLPASIFMCCYKSYKNGDDNRLTEFRNRAMGRSRSHASSSNLNNSLVAAQNDR